MILQLWLRSEHDRLVLSLCGGLKPRFEFSNATFLLAVLLTQLAYPFRRTSLFFVRWRLLTDGNHDLVVIVSSVVVV